jgi:predicted transcriptional regulator
MTHRMPPQKIRITLELTPEAGKALDDLAESTGQDVSSLFRKSLALYFYSAGSTTKNAVKH